MDVTIVSQSYSATNWQQEVCHFQNAFDKSGGVVLPTVTKISTYIGLIEPDNFLIYSY